MSDVAQMDRLPRNRRRRGRSRRRSRAASRSRGRKVFSRNKVGTIVSAQHRSDIHRFTNCKYICPPKLQKKRKIGGEGKESNLPSPTRRDRPVLKTGGATGPLPSPLRLMVPRWWRSTLAGRPSYGKTSRVPSARNVPPAPSSSVPMSTALVNTPRWRPRGSGRARRATRPCAPAAAQPEPDGRAADRATEAELGPVAVRHQRRCGHPDAEEGRAAVRERDGDLLAGEAERRERQVPARALAGPQPLPRPSRAARQARGAGARCGRGRRGRAGAHPPPEAAALAAREGEAARGEAGAEREEGAAPGAGGGVGRLRGAAVSASLRRTGRRPHAGRRAGAEALRRRLPAPAANAAGS